MQVNAIGIDQNYFYADFLYAQGEYRAALEHLDRALHAPPRPNRETADRGRRAEIETLLEKVRRKVA